jgi:hypothetical protein
MKKFQHTTKVTITQKQKMNKVEGMKTWREYLQKEKV